MTIFNGSRFLFKPLKNGVTPDGENIRYHPLQPTTDWNRDGYQTYVTKARDTFESMASKFYGDGNKWYIIADANPEVFYPLDLKAGVQIFIPPLSKANLQ